MKRWKITYADGSSTTALGDKDIWTGMPNVSSVVEESPPAQGPKPATPLSLSKTAFRAHCVARLGGGVTGILRLQEILDTLEAGSGVLKFCFGEYTGASIFDKDKTDEFLALISSVLQAGERDSIIKHWPEEA